MNKVKQLLYMSILLIGILSMFGCSKQDKAEAKADSSSTDTDAKNPNMDTSSITYNGKKYKYNTDIEPILFLGIDKKEKIAVQNIYGTGGQSDCMILIVANKKDNTATFLQISRDSMTDITLYTEDGKKYGTERAQIALQYGYGDGVDKSCRLSKQAVSNLLYGIPIRSHIAMNLEGIPAIVDTLGGVPITVQTDYSYIEPELVPGASVVLDGAKAEHFVRYRNINELGSNNGRMERQVQFLHALLPVMKDKMGGNEALFSELMTKTNPYLVTDMDAESMKKLMGYKINDEILKVPGETVAGAEHDEYIVDDTKLYDMIIQTFYVEK